MAGSRLFVQVVRFDEVVAGVTAIAESRGYFVEPTVLERVSHEAGRPIEDRKGVLSVTTDSRVVTAVTALEHDDGLGFLAAVDVIGGPFVEITNCHADVAPERWRDLTLALVSRASGCQPPPLSRSAPTSDDNGSDVTGYVTFRGARRQPSWSSGTDVSAETPARSV